jgi:hypothetical protein
VVSAAVSTKVNAWRFHEERDPSLYLEFLEFAAGSDPREEGEVATAIRSLDLLGIGDSELWIDANS